MHFNSFVLVIARGPNDRPSFLFEANNGKTKCSKEMLLKNV